MATSNQLTYGWFDLLMILKYLSHKGRPSFHWVRRRTKPIIVLHKTDFYQNYDWSNVISTYLSITTRFPFLSFFPLHKSNWHRSIHTHSHAPMFTTFTSTQTRTHKYAKLTQLAHPQAHLYAICIPIVQEHNQNEHYFSPLTDTRNHEYKIYLIRKLE